MVQRLRLAVELDALEIIRPFADTELVEEQLVERNRLDARSDGTVARPATTWLIHDIDRKMPAQKHCLKTFAPVRRRFPAATRLVGTMQHDDRQWLRILGNLIKGIEVIAMEALPFGGRIVIVVRAWRPHHRPANGQASLFLNCQGLELCYLFSHRSGRRKQGSHHHQGRDELIA